MTNSGDHDTDANGADENGADEGSADENVSIDLEHLLSALSDTATADNSTALHDGSDHDDHDAVDLSHVEMQITCGSTDEADRIAHALVTARLAACVQQLPIRSVYIWNDEVCNDTEILLLVKTTSDRISDIVDTVVDLHSYDVPAISAVPIVAGTTEYLDWVTDMTRSTNT